jgi:uncharacterized protein (UPF0333 family)
VKDRDYGEMGFNGKTVWCMSEKGNAASIFSCLARAGLLTFSLVYLYVVCTNFRLKLTHTAKS